MDQAATSLTERAALARVLVSDASAQEKIAAHKRLVFGVVKVTLADLAPGEGRPRAGQAAQELFLSLHHRLEEDLGMLVQSAEDNALARGYCKNHAAGIREFVMGQQSVILPEASDHAGLRSTDEQPGIVLVDLLGISSDDAMSRIKDIFRSQVDRFELMMDEVETPQASEMKWLWMLTLATMLTFVASDRTYDSWFELLAVVFAE